MRWELYKHGVSISILILMFILDGAWLGGLGREGFGAAGGAVIRVEVRGVLGGGGFGYCKGVELE